MEEQKDFKAFKQKTSGTRKGVPGKVRGSWGVYDAYKLMRKHGWYDVGRPVQEGEFYSIIRSMNLLMAQEVAKGNTVKFPYRMGKLELRKFKCGAYLKDDKLKITYPVDWNDTLRLWYEDEEARKNKTLLRNENPWVFYIKYCVRGTEANYNNKGFYQFRLNTFIRKQLSENIKQGKVDTLYG